MRPWTRACVAHLPTTLNESQPCQHNVNILYIFNLTASNTFSIYKRCWEFKGNFDRGDRSITYFIRKYWIFSISYRLELVHLTKYDDHRFKSCSDELIYINLRFDSIVVQWDNALTVNVTLVGSFLAQGNKLFLFSLYSKTNLYSNHEFGWKMKNKIPLHIIFSIYGYKCVGYNVKLTKMLVPSFKI